MDKINTEGERVSLKGIFLFNPKKVKFSIRNVFKCQFGCSLYEKRPSCPPFVPTYKEFENFFKSYRAGVFLSFNIENLNRKEFINRKRMIEEFLLKTERDLLVEFPYSFSFFPGSCDLCKVCSFETEGSCKRREDVRPSISGTGIDINSIHRVEFKESVIYSIILVF